MRATGKSKSDPRVNVTRAEVDYLQAERVRAMRECPDLEFQRWRRSSDQFWRWQPRLEVLGRDRDGSLLARIVITKHGADTRYVRRIRCHHSLGSTTGRDLQLRGVGKRAYC